MKTSSRIPAAALAAIVAFSSACGSLDDALTAHARPAATSVGLSLSAEDLGAMMAEASIPDSMLDGRIAEQIARLWADYVILGSLYLEPDSVRSLDLETFLRDGRYYDAFAVQELQNAVLASVAEPTDEEVREYFETRQPFTRLDLRRILLSVPPEATEEQRDSVYEAALALRERLAGGADFVEVAGQVSDDPVGRRGVLREFVGHEDVPAVADSALFAMNPGEISPVFATADGMVIYRLDQRRAPDFDRARQMTFDQINEERQSARHMSTADSLLDAARRAVQDGAPEAAIRIARDPDLAEGSIPGSAVLVRFEGGALTAEQLRALFRVRFDVRQQFALSSPEEAEALLLELAADEVFVKAARERGLAPSEEEKEEMRTNVYGRLTSVATRYGISRRMVTDPGFNLEAAAKGFVRSVLAAQQPVPWLAEFRPVIDPVYPSRVFDQGCESAASHAQDLRAARAGSDSATAGAEEPASTDGHGGTSAPTDEAAGGQAP